MRKSLIVASLLLLVVSAASANHNSFSYGSAGARKGGGEFDVVFRGVSSDGNRVFFETYEQLTNDDTDTSADVYERSGGITILVSKGAVNGNGVFNATFAAASSDGTRVFFTTAEKLTPDDSDGVVDIYQRAGGATSRISKGQTNGNGPISAIFQRALADGSRVYFTTSEKLTGDDNDTVVDTYERAAGITTRVSKGAINGNGPYDAYFGGTSADGSRVFFTSTEKLTDTDADTDGGDVYERSGGKTTLISIGPVSGTGEEPYGAAFAGASADGTHVVFWTLEPLTENDDDMDRMDLYERSGGTTTLVSPSAFGGDPGTFVTMMFSGISTDGTRVIFQTDERLTFDDSDSYQDVYAFTGGSLTRISLGEPPLNGNDIYDAVYRGASADGNRIFFETFESLRSDDVNGMLDVYEWMGGFVTRVSTGPNEGTGTPGFSSFGGASSDGAHVFFNSTAQLTSDDNDSSYDVYERFAGTTTLISKGGINGNGEYDAGFRAASANSNKVFFTTAEQLTGDDPDARVDLYQRSGTATTRLSSGEVKGNGPFPASVGGASTDGGRLFFTSGEQLTDDDTDLSVDLYQRSGTTTTRLSDGHFGGQGPFAATFRGASGDGTKVFFTTAEPLELGDVDGNVDLYQRVPGMTTHVSAGEINGDFAYDVTYAGAAADGSKVFFTSPEQLTIDEGDSYVDIYQWSAGVTTRISQGPAAGNEPYDATFRAASSTGAKVFFTTAEKLVSEDTDDVVDVYEWSGGVTTRISQGLAGGNGASPATFAGISADGGKVFFTTAEKLTYDDQDSTADLYQRSGPTTVRISQGPGTGNGAYPAGFAGAAGTHVFFTTAEQLTADDTDAQIDIYDRSGSTTTRVSRGSVNGNGAFVPTFARASSEGTSVFFTTAEPLTDDDTDVVVDVYRRASGSTTRVSQGQTNGNGAFPVTFRGISADGSRVFFTSDEVLAGADADMTTDVYERFGGTTYRISSGNGPFPATYRTASGDGKRVFFETAEKVVAADTDGSNDIYSAVAP